MNVGEVAPPAPSRHARSAPPLPVEIEVDHVGFVNYALAQSGISPVRQVVVVNRDDEALTDVTIQVSIFDVTGQSLATPWRRTLAQLPAGTAMTFEKIDLQPDPSALLDVEERRPGKLLVEVFDTGEREAGRDNDITVLAHNQWLFLNGYGSLSLELLAAFAQPNHPAVAELLTEARENLRARTGSPSTEGYQSGDERADEIVRAICEALQARAIAYTNPPAGWDVDGQKVRTPGQILTTERAGTCLDTTLLLAAAMEQAGLHPLLWMMPGHIFVGWWREEDRKLPQTVVQESAGVVNQLDLGRLGVVETTLLTAQQVPVRFDEARSAAVRTARNSEPLGIVDVHLARRSGIGPLPALHRDANGTRVVTVQAPATAPPSPSGTPAPPSPGPTTRPTAPAAPLRVQRWKNALLDLSLRNKLISLTPGASVTRLNVPEGGLAQVEDVLHGGGRLALRSADDLDEVHRARGTLAAADLPDEMLAEGIRRRQLHSDLVGDAHGARMRGLQRKARTLREESGSANLYLALGTLEWTLQGKALRSPLLLLPVTVTPGRRSSEPATLTLDEGAETTPNLCLLEKLRQELGLELPDLAAPPADEHGIDVAATFHAVRAAIDAAEMPFAVRETLDLGILQFAKFVLWKDLDEHWARFMTNPLVRHLVDTPTEAFDDGVEDVSADLDALAAACPVAADSSQLDAVARAEAGRTFVLEGPPGTGKSQTITNVLARTLAEGRRVLFVAEKRAALDVVRARLDAIGLGDLCLDLHDKASRPVAVREHLRRALDAAFSPDVEGHRRAHDDVTSRGRTLARYAGSLHAPNRVGYSLYGAHDAVLARGDGPTLPVSQEFVRSANREVLEAVRRSLLDLADLLWRVRPRRHHAWGFVRGSVDRDQIALAVSTVDAALRELAVAPPTLQTLIHAATTTQELHLIAEFARPGRPPLGLLDEVSSPRWQHASTEARNALIQFAQVPRPVLEIATPDVLTLPLEELRAEAVAARDGSFLGRKKKQQSIIERLRPALWPGAQVEPQALVGFLDDVLALREEARAAGAGAASLPGVGLPPAWNPLRDEVRTMPIGRIDELWRMARRLGDVPAGAFRDVLRAHLGDPSVENPHWVGVLERLASGLAVAAEAGNGGGDPAGALEAWRDGASLAEAWPADAANRRPELLGNWTELSRLLVPFVEHGSSETSDAVLGGEVAADDVVDAFERGLARTAFEERLASSGLAEFDAGAHERSIRRHDEASTEVRGHLRTVLPQQIVRARERSSSTALGTVRREANKKRGPSVRRLMAQHGDAILRVTPCVLVSPESLARFVDPTSTPFDVVVFDEASQIRVADAVGALGRARSAVVVGDSRQMPPTAFGGAGLEDGTPVESDEDVPDDEESTLSECVQARVPQSWLSWHYRSQDESLIAFSNQFYYDGRLASFPAPPRRGTGVAFRRVDGFFQRSGRDGLRTNRIEAQAVVDEVLRRFAIAEGELPSLGVVTFNIQQRDLIDELLRGTEDSRVVEALDRDDDRGLFVKNLENVQGDERDTVLFSIAFSRNEKGVLPLNFGPLNRAGGERRLNVAVTRARRQVVVFCSFDPGDLRDSTAVGIKHLRAYLEMAAHGVGASGDVAPAASATDRHRDDVAASLRDRGLVVRTDVGLSDFRLDLTLAHELAPDEPLVAVLLDGPGWARRRTVGDRDGMPRAVLEKVLGWPDVARVWLPRWLADRGGVADDLVAAVETAREAKAAEPEPEPEVDEADTDLIEVAPPVVVEPEPEPEPSDPEPAVPEPMPSHASLPDSYGGWTPSAPAPAVVAQPAATARPTEIEAPAQDDGPTTFEPWRPRVVGDRSMLDRLDDPAVARQVREVVVEVVGVEAPIELRRLTRLVGGAFGIARVRQARQDAILDLLPADVRVDDSEGFAWPPHRHRRSWQGYRVSDDPQSRPLAEIPLVEIANAMQAAQARQPDLEWNSDELLRATLALFGAKRLTDGAWSRLDEARRLARRTGA